MESIIFAIQQKIGKVQASHTSVKKARSCDVLNDYDEKRRAYYIGKVSGYNIAKAILSGIKLDVKEVKVVDARVIVIKDCSYVAYLRTIRTLSNVINATRGKINHKNGVQSTRLLGQDFAISDIVNELKGFFLKTSLQSTYN